MELTRDWLRPGPGRRRYRRRRRRRHDVRADAEADKKNGRCAQKNVSFKRGSRQIWTRTGSNLIATGQYGPLTSTYTNANPKIEN